MKIALIGNPNSGKTTLFNVLTRQNQKIGNWPGVTVERKTGKYFKNKEIEIIDLPGVYSLNPITHDEKITAEYLKNAKPDTIINIVDSTTLERGLALTLQLLEQKIPTVIAFNMADELKLNGLEIDTSEIEAQFDTHACLISAKKNAGIETLMEKAIHMTEFNHDRKLFISKGKTEEAKMEYRHKYISENIDRFRVRHTSKAHRITDKIDKILLNRWLAFPIFAAIISLMYFVSVQLVGAVFGEATEWLFDTIGEKFGGWLEEIGAMEWVVSLFVDGIIAGVGAVLGFIPQIAMLFLFITFLEGCGYMARVAVIMDRIFKKLGLSGKSFIPLIVGCGCSVPAIMSTKTIENIKERRATIMLTPFIPCSAKLPVFALIAGVMFPSNPFIAPSMYFLGIFMVILGGLLLKVFNRTQNEKQDIFCMELPHYRLPKATNIFKELWQKTRGFVVRAGMIIVPAAIILWFLQSFSFKMQMVDIEDSMLAFIGRCIAWIFYPLGFGNWESSIAYLTGVFAKETVVATFGVILAGEEAELTAIFTPWSAYAFMAFMLLSAPCVAALAATKKELGSNKWFFITIAFQFLVAYFVAMFINVVGLLWTHDRTSCISVLAIIFIFVIFVYCIRKLLRRKRCGGDCAKCGGCCK